ncbi:MAG TPA: poly-beta-hydroxybutyrate polymerase N-terminal domain-containing protein, partial [Trinickia sp.]|nr:poly-beta-hydroxybutyrate polymerase N-terminal domain-containing protein [Trinickia sp.]
MAPPGVMVDDIATRFPETLLPTVLPAELRAGPDGAKERSNDSADAALSRLDRAVYATLARATRGASPAALALAWLDWAQHFAYSPGKQYALDPRFDDAEWNRWPFNVLRDTFAQIESFWQEATCGVRGVSRHHEQVVRFAARQWTDMLSPANCWWLNPQVLRAMVDTGGRNFLNGAWNWLEDQQDLLSGSVPGTA